jgi:predicted nucleic-acid-binding protein
MIGLDTNVVVRYLVQDDPTQARHATRLIEACTSDEPGFISIVALAEITWVLKVAYGASRDEIANVIENLLQTETLGVQLADVAWKALSVYRKGSADFADCLIERIGAANDCDATYTFDQVAARDAGMRLLSAKS